MTDLKSSIKQLAQKFGLKLSRYQKTPYEYLLRFPRYKEISVTLLGQEFKITDPLSFYLHYQEIFLKETYRFEAMHDAPVILDCGSNYGVSIIYFKSKYPGAIVTGVEADPRIFQLLNWNIRQRNLEGITLFNKAVSTKNTPVTFYCEGAVSGRAFPGIQGTETVEIIPVQLDELITGSVDFLKMDIEGSETEVICSSSKLGEVRQIFIEYHSFAETPQMLDNLLAKLSATGFRYYIHTAFCSPRPLIEKISRMGMDMRLNIFATK